MLLGGDLGCRKGASAFRPFALLVFLLFSFSRGSKSDQVSHWVWLGKLLGLRNFQTSVSTKVAFWVPCFEPQPFLRTWRLQIEARMANPKKKKSHRGGIDPVTMERLLRAAQVSFVRRDLQLPSPLTSSRTSSLGRLSHFPRSC